MSLRLYCIIILTLLAFAANSLLTRYALGSNLIDPLSFTSIRLISGALALCLIVIFYLKKSLFNIKIIDENEKNKRIDTKIGLLFLVLKNGFWLLLYALSFSFAYITLNTATGALLLFGTVQLWMLSHSLLKGHQLTTREWLGFVLACIGFLLLTLPYISTPSATGLLLMIIAGIAWACYTLNGQNSRDAIPDTARNFLYASLLLIPALILFTVFSEPSLFFTPNGILAALASGVLASGIGYALWYSALPFITTTQASTLQLLVPLIAALSGLVLLNEPLTLMLVAAGLVMLSGIYLVIKK